MEDEARRPDASPTATPGATRRVHRSAQPVAQVEERPGRFGRITQTEQHIEHPQSTRLEDLLNRVGPKERRGKTAVASP